MGHYGLRRTPQLPSHLAPPASGRTDGAAPLSPACAPPCARFWAFGWPLLLRGSVCDRPDTPASVGN